MFFHLVNFHGANLVLSNVNCLQFMEYIDVRIISHKSDRNIEDRRQSAMSNTQQLQILFSVFIVQKTDNDGFANRTPIVWTVGWRKL